MKEDKGIIQYVEDFIVYKKSLGYFYDSQKYFLFNYANFALSIDPNSEYPKKEIVDSYIDSLVDSHKYLCGSITCLREFSKYLIKIGVKDAYIIPGKLTKNLEPEPPYFFTKKEIEDFFRELQNVEALPHEKGRDIVLPVIFILLYCCGLRCKEVRTLKCENVHLDELYLDILNSKGPKSRRIFITQELKEYLEEYDKKINILFPQRTYFFPTTKSKGYYSSSFISNNFKKYWLRAYPNFNLTTRPRAYDFRHHFAYENINKWTREGLDVNVMCAYLMKYMGHETISETLYYFHFVPEFFPTYLEMNKSLEDIIPEVAND